MAKVKKSRFSSATFVYGGIAGTALGLFSVLVFRAGAIVLLSGLFLIAIYTLYLTRRLFRNGSLRVAESFQAPLLAVLVIGTFSIVGAHYYDLSFAWHPSGTIKKTAQDITKNGRPLDADNEAGEVHADAGDTLRYAVTVSNVATDAANHENDMANTVMTDTLPDGIELVSDPSATMIVEDLGTILPGKSVVKTYDVKILSTVKDDAILINKVCFTANSIANDNPQSGCDEAYVRADNEGSTSSPTPTPTPNQSPTPSPTQGSSDTPTPSSGGGTVASSGGSGTGTTVDLPSQLPDTGAHDILIVAAFAVLGGYITHEWYWYARQTAKKKKATLR